MRLDDRLGHGCAQSLAGAVLAASLLAAQQPVKASAPKGVPWVECALEDGTPIRLQSDPGDFALGIVRGCQPIAPPKPVPEKAVGRLAGAPHFLCEFRDGRRGFSANDLSRDFPETVRACTAQADEEGLPARRPEPVTLTPLPVPVEFPDLRPVATAKPLPADIEMLVRASSQRHGVDPQLVAAIMHVESRGQALARSPKGALGLMQVMPATGQRYGVSSPNQLLDPAVNVDTGVRYLRDLLAMFGGETHLALAAYNAGEGAVMRHGRRIPPFAETQSYVQQVLSRYRVLGSSSAHRPESPAARYR